MGGRARECTGFREYGQCPGLCAPSTPGELPDHPEVWLGQVRSAVRILSSRWNPSETLPLMAAFLRDSIGNSIFELQIVLVPAKLQDDPEAHQALTARKVQGIDRTLEILCTLGLAHPFTGAGIKPGGL